MTVATPTIQLTTDSGDAADLITKSANLTFSTAATGVTRTYQINADQATSKYEVPPEDGDYTVLVTDTDSSGSSASASITFRLDTLDPTTPVVSLEDDTGDSNTDGITRYAYLSENASETGATRSYTLNGVASDSYVMPSLDASYVLVVKDTDAAGNAVSATLEFTLDTTLAAPTAALSLDSGDDADGITNAAGVSFSALTSGDIRSYTINDGEASSEFLTPTEEGTYKVVVIDTDTAGNTDTTTLVFEFDKTLTAPKAVLAVDSGESEEDRITNNAALSLNTQDDDATRLYQINGGTASETYSAPVVDGSYTVLVTDTDTAGNTDKVSASFTLDTTLTTPTAAFASGSDTGSSAQDAISNSAALAFNTADTDATRVYTLSKSGVVVSSGAEYSAPSADGVYDLAVTDTDTAGNTKSATLGFTLDTTAPTVPTVILGIDSGTSGDRLTNSATLTFNSKDADATRSYTLSLDGTQIVQGAQYTTPTVDGDYVLVVQDTDTAGNTSRAEISFTLDATLAQPTVSLAYDSGTAADLISNTAALSFSEVASDVTRTYAVNNVSGATSYTAPTTDGAYTVVVTDKDTAGNIKTATLSFALDSAIKAPTVALANGYTGAGTTDSAAMTFNAPDSDATRVYTITTNGVGVGVGVSSASYVAPKVSGFYQVAVTDTDTAGNVASTSLDFTLEIIGKTVDFQAYHWKSHVLLGDVVISDGSQTVTTENGLGQFTAVTESTLLVTAERAIPALEADITSASVNLQDAIAILKMVVGLDVNGSGKALSPYQALAADFNGDGVVSLTDAIGVLKHVVGLTQTSTPQWAFANEADLDVPAKASTTPGDAPAISSDLSAVVEVDVHFGLVGYLVGDVDGSFAGLSTATNLLTSDSTYFTDLVTATSGLSLSQFGVYS